MTMGTQHLNAFRLIYILGLRQAVQGLDNEIDVTLQLARQTRIRSLATNGRRNGPLRFQPLVLVCRAQKPWL